MEIDVRPCEHKHKTLTNMFCTQYICMQKNTCIHSLYHRWQRERIHIREVCGKHYICNWIQIHFQIDPKICKEICRWQKERIHIREVSGAHHMTFASQKNTYLGKPQFENCRVYLGIAQMGEGVSTLAQMIWGTYF